MPAINCLRTVLSKYWIVPLLLLALHLNSLPCRAQGVNATLTGEVTDPSGGAVPQATVTATNVDTGVATGTTTDPAGVYTFASLPAGNYRIVAEKSGFKSTEISGITLLVYQKATLNITLQVGEVSTKVEVSGAAPLVSTTSASVGTVVGQQQVVDLPLNLREVGALAILVPGTVTDNGGFASSTLGSPFSQTTYVASGTRDSSNNTLIDGVDSRNMTFGGFALQPTPDAVQEFRIQTNVYDAAFGKAAGSTINLLTKSGTNQIHGTAYEFLRNSDLDAANLEATNQINPVTNQEIPGTARPEFRRNQYGVSMGGPIRKNKTFWFANYEGLRQIQGLSLTSFVPTDAEKSGNFSSFLTGQSMNLCGANGPANLNFDTGQLFLPGTESLFTCPAGSALQNSTVPSANRFRGTLLRTSTRPARKQWLFTRSLIDPGFRTMWTRSPWSRIPASLMFGSTRTLVPEIRFSVATFSDSLAASIPPRLQALCLASPTRLIFGGRILPWDGPIPFRRTF